MKPLRRIRPDRDRYEIQRMFNRMLGESFPPAFFDDEGWPSPPLDLRETEGEIIVEMCVPGFKPDDIHITVIGDILSIRGEILEEEAREEETYHLRERQIRSFKRSIPLPAQVEADKAEAVFANGELKLTLPKAPEARARTIEIKVK